MPRPCPSAVISCVCSLAVNGEDAPMCQIVPKDDRSAGSVVVLSRTERSSDVSALWTLSRSKRSPKIRIPLATLEKPGGGGVGTGMGLVGHNDPSAPGVQLACCLPPGKTGTILDTRGVV